MLFDPLPESVHARPRDSLGGREFVQRGRHVERLGEQRDPLPLRVGGRLFRGLLQQAPAAPHDGRVFHRRT